MTQTQVMTRLKEVLFRSNSEVARAADGGLENRTLEELGMDSVAILTFLVAVEDAFGVEWEDEVDPSTLNSLQSISEFLVDELGTAA